MIRVLQLSQGKKKKIINTSINNWVIGKTFSWVDCFKPSLSDLDILSKKTGIPVSDFKESIDINKRPHVIQKEKYSLIIFRGLYEANEKFNTVPVAIFIFKKDVITLHGKLVKGLDNLRRLKEGQMLEIFRKGAAYFIYSFMDKVTSDFFNLIENVEDNINKIEDQVVLKPKEAITKHIFIQKRKIIYINKSLVANREVISSLEKGYLKEFKQDDLRLLRNLYYDVAQLIDLINTYRDVLTSVLDMYLSSVSNSLNKVMKTLTVISAFVLVPTLISGIYGMNFQKVSGWNMPELYWIYGYPFALSLMLFSILILYIWFRKKEWI